MVTQKQIAVNVTDSVQLHVLNTTNTFDHNLL